MKIPNHILLAISVICYTETSHVHASDANDEMLSSPHTAKFRLSEFGQETALLLFVLQESHTSQNTQVHNNLYIPVRYSVISATSRPFNVVNINSAGADSEDQSAEWSNR